MLCHANIMVFTSFFPIQKINHLLSFYPWLGMLNSKDVVNLNYGLLTLLSIIIHNSWFEHALFQTIIKPPYFAFCGHDWLYLTEIDTEASKYLSLYINATRSEENTYANVTVLSEWACWSNEKFKSLYVFYIS